MMNYTDYTNLSTEELLTAALTHPDISDITLELALRLEATLDEVDDLTGEIADLAGQLARFENGLMG
jgi:hypothetical protein